MARKRSRRNSVRTLIAIALAVGLSACAAPDAASPSKLSACSDLSGRYENQSSPSGHKLAPLFFGTDDRADAIEVASAGSTIVVSTANRTVTLEQERDYVCGPEGVRLTKTDVRNIRLPPLLVEKEIFHYVLSREPDGTLRMTEQVESQGKSFGIPMGTGQKQQRSEVRWRRAPPQ